MAGLLSEIFSAGNVAKRKLTDLLGNPLESAQQILGNMNDRARVLNQMTAAAAREGVAYGPASQQLGGLLSEAYNPAGLTVFHGSPYPFKKFDPTKIGSGEGAQAYGYGHYVAENPNVAKDYQKRLAKENQANDLNTKMNFVDVGGKPLSTFNVDVDSALIDAAKSGKQDFINLANSKKTKWEKLSSDESYPYRDYAKEKVSGYENLLSAAKTSNVDYTGSGVIYKIDLPDEQISKMLDWDKPLNKQPKEVKDALSKLGVSVDEKQLGDYTDALLAALEGTGSTNLPKQPLNLTGGEIYRKLGNPQEATQMLREAGIPGIRYLDQGSRGVGEGTSNFVVFPGNEDLLKILERNNQPLGLLE